VSILAFVTALPESITRYTLVFVPTAFLATGFAACQFSDAMQPFMKHPATGSGVLPGDTFWFVRLSAWYSNCDGARNGPPFAVMVLALGLTLWLFLYRRIQNLGCMRVVLGFTSKYLPYVPYIGMAVLRLWWAYHFITEQGWTTYYNDVMNSTIQVNGKTALMAPAWYTDYFGMGLVWLVFVVCEGAVLEGAAFVVMGNGFGLTWAVETTLAKPRRNVVAAALYFLAALISLVIWLPYQMTWVDYIVTTDTKARFAGGFLNHNITYATLAVTLGCFALLPFILYYYASQTTTPTFIKSQLFFSASLFMLYHVAICAAVVLAFANLAEENPPVETGEDENKKGK